MAAWLASATVARAQPAPPAPPAEPPSAESTQNVDALLQDLEGILSDVMGTGTVSPPTSTNASNDASKTDAGSTAPTAPAAAAATPAASPATDEAVMASEMGLADDQAPADPGAADSGQPAPVPAPAAAAPAVTDTAAPAQSAKATGPVVIPGDGSGGAVIEPATPTVPPAVAVDAVPERALSAAEKSRLMKEAMSWFMTEEYRQAVSKLIELLRADPQHAEARYYLAYARYRMGDFPQARAEFHALYQVKSDFSPVKRDKRPVPADTDKGRAQSTPDAARSEAEGTGTASAAISSTAPAPAPAAPTAPRGDPGSGKVIVDPGA